jgi:hypothetical protein
MVPGLRRFNVQKFKVQGELRKHSKSFQPFHRFPSTLLRTGAQFKTFQADRRRIRES